MRKFFPASWSPEQRIAQNAQARKQRCTFTEGGKEGSAVYSKLVNRITAAARIRKGNLLYTEFASPSPRKTFGMVVLLKTYLAGARFELSY